MQDHSKPLAELLRPEDFTQFIGQKHLVSPGSVLYQAVESGIIPSMILWGPPGVGKTTLASIISKKTDRPFFTLSAVNSGVKEVREVIQRSVDQQQKAILFIDEIHRFSKSQQDSLLGAVENGTISLIGATTENPSFEVIAPLLSRCQVYILRTLEEDDLLLLLESARKKLEELYHFIIRITETEALLRISGGDARKLLNAVELVSKSLGSRDPLVEITNEKVLSIIQQNLALYDKLGEMHYDVISAFIKSIRGSDPNAAVYWLARMIRAGEDPKFIARRLLILASEDIGNANPNALLLASECFHAVTVIGYPECELILSQTVLYLASSAKSNASCLALHAAYKAIDDFGDLPVPLHLRNAPTKLMKKAGYGKEYQYAHDFPGNFVLQDFLPDKLKGRKLFEPQHNAREEEIRKRLRELWQNHYRY